MLLPKIDTQLINQRPTQDGAMKWSPLRINKANSKHTDWKIWEYTVDSNGYNICMHSITYRFLGNNYNTSFWFFTAQFFFFLMAVSFHQIDVQGHQCFVCACIHICIHMASFIHICISQVFNKPHAPFLDFATYLFIYTYIDELLEDNEWNEGIL